MNIFWIERTAPEIARSLCNQHIAAQIRELAQMLSTALHERGFGDDPVLMKPTHVNHPCTRWVRESSGNFLFAVELLVHVIDEADRRFGYSKRDGTIKHHRAREIAALALDFHDVMPAGARTRPPQVFDEIYHRHDYVEGYRNYYKNEKRVFKDGRAARWTATSPPRWFTIHQQ